MDRRRECEPVAHLEEQEEDVRSAIICQTFALHHCAQLAAGTNLHQQLASVAASTLLSRPTCSQHSGGILIEESMLDNCMGRSRSKQLATADLSEQSHHSNRICGSQYGAKQQALRPAPAIGEDELGHKGSEDATNDHPRTCQEQHLQKQC